MPAGLGGGGAVHIALETTMGEFVPPSNDGVWVPITSEDFVYNEDKYYSPQIRQQTIVSSVEQSYYHIGGTLGFEVDVNYAPYFMVCSRHNIEEAGGVLRVSPGSQGSAVGGGAGTQPRTLSITIFRNNKGFGYAGCVVSTWEETIDNGVLKWSLGMLGLSETDTDDLDTFDVPWLDPSLFGAAAHAILIDEADPDPAFADDPTVDFNGWTFRSDFNGAPQNRIVRARSASYISFGETNANYETELDFQNKDDYTSMKDNVTRAIRKESIKMNDGTAPTDWASCDEGMRTQVNRTSFDNYTVALGGMGDLIMARVTGRAIGISAGDAYSIECKGGPTVTA